MSSKNSIKIIGNSIWISDLHLGSTGCQSDKIESFLNAIECNNLFLNGDIVDDYVVSNTTTITERFQAIFKQLKSLQDNGTKLTILKGNHDNYEKLKLIFPNISILDEVKYKTISNKLYLVFHGDKCDASIKLKTNFIAKLSTTIYEQLLSLRKSTKKKHFSRNIKVLTKKAIAFVFQNEKKLINYLKKSNVDGVICGHSHQPIIKQLNNKDYLNSGDWIDNCTYIIETREGEFKLEKWLVS